MTIKCVEFKSLERKSQYAIGKREYIYDIRFVIRSSISFSYLSEMKMIKVLKHVAIKLTTSVVFNAPHNAKCYKLDIDRFQISMIS